MSYKTNLELAYHMGYDDALARRMPDMDKVAVLNEDMCHADETDTWERIIEDAREYRLNINGSYLWKNKSDELVARCKALAGDVE